ncbi:ABC transporter substrate-binding protein [Paenibacillaceae bacterium]|nr:ABC transporter substrate-binding protein [Paenibacillaceae bacterium]
MLYFKKMSGIFFCGVIVLLAACANQAEIPAQLNNEGAIDAVPATRIIEDAGGTVTIPAKPLRIADVSGSTEELLILGHRPVLTGNTDMRDPLALTPILTEQLGEQQSGSKAAVAGWFQTEVNIEAVMEAAPDLIFAGPTQENIVDQLEKIAPTVRVPYGFNAFRERFAFIAQVLDKTADMEAWIQDYEQLADELHGQIAAATGEGTFAIIEATQKEIRIYARTGVADIVFHDLKLPQAPGTPSPDGWGGKVTSLEALSSFDADHIILMADSEQNVLEESNIWKGLKAVKENHIYRMTTRQNYNEAFFALGKRQVMEQLADDILKAAHNK